MALANLNINVNANVNNAVNAMVDFKTVANASMFASSDAVAKFQAAMAQNAANINGNAQGMSKQFGAAGVEISKAANLSSESIAKVDATAKAAAGGMNELSKSVDGAAQNIKSSAIGKEIQQQAEQSNGAWQKIKDGVSKAADAVKGFVVKSIAVAGITAIFGAVAGAVAALGFAAYKAAGFIAGLFTGESYKSTNIDAVIALNKEVSALQESLQMTAQDANAMNDAIKRIGANKDDVIAVFNKIEDVTRGGNTDGLDRLGVVYKDVNDRLLDTTKIAQNAKNVLDQYTSGWDRNKAAAEMGLGTYAQITEYLRVNQAEVQKSKDRLDEYNLGIGPDTQKAVAEYQTAMNEFNNETRLMSEGFHRAISDQIMPAFTSLSGVFKDGWPYVVNIFRYSMAQITSLAYGLKESFDLVWHSVSGAIMATGEVVLGVGKAAAAALTGDFSGAKAALAAGWNSAVVRIDTAGQRIAEDSRKNAAAMKLAWAFDDRTATAGGRPGSGKTPGKSYTPPPDADAGEPDYTSKYSALNEKYLAMAKSFNDRLIAEQKDNSKLQLDILKTQYDTGIISAQEYYSKRLNIQITANDNERKNLQKQISDLTADADLYMRKGNSEDDDQGKKAQYYTQWYESLAKIENLKKEMHRLDTDRTSIENDTAQQKAAAELQIFQTSATHQEKLLEYAGDQVAAEQIKQEAYKRTYEWLKLQADAARGSADAAKTVAAIQKENAIAVAQKQADLNASIRDYADAAAKAADAVAKLYGKTQEEITAESNLRDGVSKEAALRDKLLAAEKAGNAVAISSLNTQISAQSVLNQRLQAEVDLLQRKEVLLGQIVGFNGNTPIYSNYADVQKQLGYVSNSTLTSSGSSSGSSGSTSGFLSVGSLNSTPFLGGFDVGTDYVPRTGLALIHEGERIVTAADNAAGNYGTTIHAPITINGANMSSDQILREIIVPLKRALGRSL